MFSLENVSKSFGDTLVIKPTTVEFPTGRSTVLIGPSGCGKSTLLRMLVGLITPDSGCITFDGTEINSANLTAARRRMGYVIQDGGLFPHLTAFENVSLMARHVGWSQDKIQQRVDELSDLTRLPKASLSRYPTQMSGGQRQRVGIMRALMLDPPVLLLDEPMGALDPMVRFDLQEDLLKIFRMLQKTSIMVTHDMGEAGFFGDDVMILSEGEIVQQGRLDDLIHHPANEYVSRFINAQRIPKV
ncbi:MAG: ATP-binding cassette domain-containing protein [Aureliella sp.]